MRNACIMSGISALRSAMLSIISSGNLTYLISFFSLLSLSNCWYCSHFKHFLLPLPFVAAYTSHWLQLILTSFRMLHTIYYILWCSGILPPYPVFAKAIFDLSIYFTLSDFHPVISYLAHLFALILAYFSRLSETFLHTTYLIDFITILYDFSGFSCRWSLQIPSISELCPFCNTASISSINSHLRHICDIWHGWCNYNG